uniref:Uncharacterized protein n=1 Tax=viral metagenome TaxID=1070528 RepID=A0A6C0F8I2_9ZZZZ|tara:strand:- start:5111 stop:5308 length:198 start_codon:yes stop_codon:yes gene_type:complete
MEKKCCCGIFLYKRKNVVYHEKEMTNYDIYTESNQSNVGNQSNIRNVISPTKYEVTIEAVPVNKN